LQEQSGAQQNTPAEINHDFQPSTITSLSSLVAKQPLAKRQKVGPIARQIELLELACDFLKDSKTAVSVIFNVAFFRLKLRGSIPLCV
jgi:hypothetical protein